MFDECFSNLDGRAGNDSRMSLTSTLSRALSIKTRQASVISYGGIKTRVGEAGKTEAMKRVAVTLR